MKRLFKMIASIGLIGLVAACGHVKIGDGLIYEDTDPQAYAGLTLNNLKFCKNELGGFEICDATAVDGKEQAEVQINWTVNQDGMFQLEYSAIDTKAFEAFRTIADVRARFGDIVADTLLSLAVPPNIALASTPSDGVLPDSIDPN